MEHRFRAGRTGVNIYPTGIRGKISATVMLPNRNLGGGVVLTLCHPFDYLRWILGEVDSLWAFTSVSDDLPIGTESTAEIGLQFASGATGSVHLDYIQQPGSHTLDIIGTRDPCAGIMQPEN